MQIAKMPRWTLALGLALLSGTMARADFSYTAVGSFVTIGGSNTYTQGTATISYVVPATTAANPPSNFSMGSFDTTGTTGTTTLTVTPFFLQVYDLNTGNEVTFSGSLQGTLGGLSSDAYIQFTSPLTQVLDGYTIHLASADNSTAGRLEIVPPSAGMITSIQSNVAPAAVPEPSTMALMGLGGSAFVGLAARRRLRRGAAA